MKNIKVFMHLLLSLPKTVYFNFKVFDFLTATKLPVFISWRVKIYSLARGTVIVPQNCKTGLIKIGFGGTSVMNIGSSAISLPKGGRLEFVGRAHFARGVCIKNSGNIIIGDYFSANNNLRLTCSNSVTIESQAMIGWNVVIRDSDGHYIIENGIQKEKIGKVFIGRHVWVCAEAHILKGAKIGNDSVVAYKSLVTSEFSGNNLLLAGTPAKIIKDNINWQQ